MSEKPIRWYVVMLPGETADMSELFGPFRIEAQADEACERWNFEHATNGDRATVLPIHPARDLKDAA
jgi:hypothetical protein